VAGAYHQGAVLTLVTLFLHVHVHDNRQCCVHAHVALMNRLLSPLTLSLHACTVLAVEALCGRRGAAFKKKACLDACALKWWLSVRAAEQQAVPGGVRDGRDRGAVHRRAHPRWHHGCRLDASRHPP